MLPQLLMVLWTVAHEVREIKTYGLSKMSCTTKHLLSSLFIFLLNLPYMYVESSGPSLLYNNPGPRPQGRVWAVFLGCLWRPQDRGRSLLICVCQCMLGFTWVVLPGLRISPNYFPVFWKGDTETSTSNLMYCAAFVRFPWGTMTLRISCKALEDIYLSVIIFVYCSACPCKILILQVGLCVCASECVFLYVRTCVHQGMGPILCVSTSLCSSIPVYQERKKCNEGEILLPSS